MDAGRALADVQLLGDLAVRPPRRDSTEYLQLAWGKAVGSNLPGVAALDAARQGAERRLRPVLMTAMVAALGFLPMALASAM